MLVKSATRLNNISRLRDYAGTREPVESPRSLIKVTYGSLYFSCSVSTPPPLPFLLFSLSFFSSPLRTRDRGHAEVNAWRTKRDRRDEISETGYLPLAAFMREVCVTRFYASDDPVDDGIPSREHLAGTSAYNRLICNEKKKSLDILFERYLGKSGGKRGEEN